MKWKNIIIVGLVILIVYFLFFNNKNENFEVLDNKIVGTNEYYKQLCDKTSKENTDVKKYLEDNCTEKKIDDIKNFKKTINNRNWCRIKNEEEITSNMNKDTWCSLMNNEIKTSIIGNDEPNTKLLGNIK
jgi:hypothetical protein